MFTGLIESVCAVTSAIPTSGGTMKLTVELGPLANDTRPGDSIAINGACLTVAQLNGARAVFELSAETVKKSTLTRLKASDQVNAERALKADGRLGGHFVTGHVDGSAVVKKVDKRDGFAEMVFSAGPELLNTMIEKGSVAVDGVSLTVVNVDRDHFSVAVIPETLARTTLGRAKIGDQVNIETDMIVKVIGKYLEKILPKEEGLTVENLRKFGF